MGRRPGGEGPKEGRGAATTPSSFEDAVVEVLRGLGPGDVVTYGEVAAEAGRPGAARAVGRILATSDGAHPWWRVVTATGRLVPGHEAEHARRLRAEGVEVDAATGRVRRPRLALRPGRAGGATTGTGRPGGTVRGTEGSGR